ncbi:MAG: T9SS type A sorting domain-containing protein [Candidatus Latescibacteria bacterium]|nr:T9SS type A sorting domain-containing protein [Candidatus Latescibacterota bacterium]
MLSSSLFAATGDWDLYTSVVKINDILAGERYVWAATDGGVLRLHPTEGTFTIYTTLDGLAGNKVLCIAEDSQGNLWFGTEGDGLSKFGREKTFTTFRPFPSPNPINSLFFENDSTLYVATDVGVSLFSTYKDEIKETYHQFGTLPRNSEAFCVKVIGKYLWAGTTTGVAHAPLFQPSGVRSNLQDPTSWSSTDLKKKVYSIIQADSVIYIGTENGGYSYENNRWYPRLPLPSYDLLIYQEKLLVATERYGVFQSPLSCLSHWKRNTSLPKKTKCLAVSPDPALWAGVEGGYLVRAKSGEVDSFQVNCPAANTFMDLTFDHQGRLWVASSYRDQTGCRGAYCFDGEKWTNHFATPTPLGKWTAENSVVCVVVDSRSRIWLGTWGAGIHLSSEQGDWELIDQDNSILKGIPTNPDYLVINDICEDRNGNIWMSDYQQGVAVFDDFPPSKKMFYTPSEDGLPSGGDGELWGSVITIDETGLKWIGTFNAGFCLFDDGGTPFQRGDDTVIIFSTSFYPEEMISNNITDIAFDEEGVLWIGTDSGVNAIRGRYNPIIKDYTYESWNTYLREITVNRILVDPQNNKWFATENGLYRFSADGTSWTHYTQGSCGLVDNRVKSLAFDELAGELWIGTPIGLNRFKIPRPSLQQVALVYPNPFISGAEKDQVTFPGLSPNSTVRIYTLLGESVRTLTADEFGETTWDGTNSLDNLVASGIYFYSFCNQNGKQLLGKLAILRKDLE